MTPEEAAATAQNDKEFVELLDLLPEYWASLPSDEDGAEMAATFVRAAYGRGYVTALERSS